MCNIHRGSKVRGWHLEVCMGFLSPASFWFLLCQCSHLAFLAGLGDWGWGWGMMLKRAHWQTFLKHHKIFRNKVPQMTFALMNYAFQQLPAFFTVYACFFFILENICLVSLFVCLFVNSTLQKMVIAVQWHHSSYEMVRLKHRVVIVFQGNTTHTKLRFTNPYALCHVCPITKQSSDVGS